MPTTAMSRRMSCAESDRLRVNLSPWSSCTNYVGGEVLDNRLPPHTCIEWCDPDETVRLIDVRDADGCRHMLVGGTDDE